MSNTRRGFFSGTSGILMAALAACRKQPKLCEYLINIAAARYPAGLRHFAGCWAGGLGLHFRRS